MWSIKGSCKFVFPLETMILMKGRQDIAPYTWKNTLLPYNELSRWWHSEVVAIMLYDKMNGIVESRRARQIVRVYYVKPCIILAIFLPLAQSHSVYKPGKGTAVCMGVDENWSTKLWGHNKSHRFQINYGLYGTHLPGKYTVFQLLNCWTYIAAHWIDIPA